MEATGPCAGKQVPLSEHAIINPSTSVAGLGADDLVSFIPMEDVTEGGQWINGRVRRLSEVQRGYTSFQEGDVLLAKITPCMENGKAAHARGLRHGIGFGSTEFHILRVRPNVDARYIYHWIQSTQLRLKAEAMMSGSAGQCRVPVEFFDKFSIPYIPESEQRRIAEILDTVDEAIQKTEALIAKLKQVKAGLLHDLLTRGIDENGQLRDPVAHPEQFKDSSLGPIPMPWDVRHLHEIADLQVGFAFKSEWFQEVEGPRLLRGENVGTGNLDWTDTQRLPEHLLNGFRGYLLRPGDIVIGMDRTFTKQGTKISTVDHSDLPALLVQRVGRFIARGVFMDFLRAILHSQSYRHELISQEKGMDIPHLSKSEILRPRVPVPPRREQERIAEILVSYDGRLATESEYASKLKQLKNGLMEDLLTGRVRVNKLEQVAL